VLFVDDAARILTWRRSPSASPSRGRREATGTPRPRLSHHCTYSGGGAALTVRFALRVCRLNARSTAALRKWGAAMRR
jgi:hypothetical protein